MKVVSLCKNYYINLVFSLDSLPFAVSTSAPGLRWAEKEFSSPMLQEFPTAAATDYHNLAAEKWHKHYLAVLEISSRKGPPGLKSSVGSSTFLLEFLTGCWPHFLASRLLAPFAVLEASDSTLGSFSSLLRLLSLWLLFQLAWEDTELHRITACGGYSANPPPQTNNWAQLWGSSIYLNHWKWEDPHLIQIFKVGRRTFNPGLLR